MDTKLIAAVQGIKWLSVPVMRDGSEVIGAAVSEVTSALRDQGWRRVPRIDSADLRSAGFRVVRARYRSWGGLKKECDVLVLRD